MNRHTQTDVKAALQVFSKLKLDINSDTVGLLMDLPESTRKNFCDKINKISVVSGLHLQSALSLSHGTGQQNHGASSSNDLKATVNEKDSVIAAKDKMILRKITGSAC